MLKKENKTQETENPFYLSISDLMAGLFLLFIFISVVAMQQVEDKIEETDSVQRAIFKLLKDELEEVEIDLKIDEKSGTVSIADTILFRRASHIINSKGKEFLDKFIPILSRVVYHSAATENEIISIDIEGYTSEKGRLDKAQMRLSLNRAESVWEYIHQKSNRKESGINPKIVDKFKVCGWGNIKATSKEDLPQDRKVVFQFQFRGLMEKFKLKRNFEQQAKEQK